jgi:hypothetical protein
MAKRELKVHYVPAGQKVWTICGMKVRPRVKHEEHPYTCGAAVVTCGNCAKAMKEMKAREDFNAEAVSRREVERVYEELRRPVVHLDKGSTTGCGASAEHSTQCLSNVTCLTCLRWEVRMLTEQVNKVTGQMLAAKQTAENQEERVKELSLAMEVAEERADKKCEEAKYLREHVEQYKAGDRVQSEEIVLLKQALDAAMRTSDALKRLAMSK